MDTERHIFYRALVRLFKYKPAKCTAILENISDPGILFRMSGKQLAECGFTKDEITGLKNRELLENTKKSLEWEKANGIEEILYTDNRYPETLLQTYGYPPCLLKKGCGKIDMKRKTVAIVGTRKPTRYGISACASIIKRLVEMPSPPVIISGLAEGIDFHAHMHALDAGLPTIGISATGHDRIYPACNTELFREVSSNGLILSEYENGTRASKFHFLQRNRIIAGMSDAVIIIESRIRGGAMNTANHAFSFNREVFAVPGRVGDMCSEGCNMLIADNKAHILNSFEHFMKIMDWDMSNKEYICTGKTNMRSLEERDKHIIAKYLHEEGPHAIPEIAKYTGLDERTLFSKLAEMEIEGILELGSGNEYKLASEYDDRY